MILSVDINSLTYCIYPIQPFYKYNTQYFIADMYGMKGGNKSNCVYPTVANVRHEFYKEW